MAFGLSELIGGVGDWIGGIGKGVVNMIGSGVASARDLGAMMAGNYDPNNSEDLKWKKFMTGADNAKDAYAMSAGQALKSATNLSDLALMLGTGGTSKMLSSGAGAIATNAIQGAAGGFADELEANGANWSQENAGKRMLSGMLSGAATAGLGNGISGATGKSGNKLLNNKFTQSAFGRGALTGAVGGAVGGGTMTALSGGSLGDIVGNALSTGAAGGITGGLTSSVMSGAAKLGDKAINKLWTAEQNHSFQNAISNPSSMKESVYLGEISGDSLNNIKAAYEKAGIDFTDDTVNAMTVKDGKLYLTQDGAKHLNQRRIQQNQMSAKQVRQTMRNATGNGVVSPELTNRGNVTMGAQNGDKYDIAHLGVNADGNLDLKTAYESNGGQVTNQIKAALAGSQAASYQENPGLASETSALQGDNANISQQKQNVNSDLMYGESQLANRTKRGMVADSLERFGNTLEGAQTNVTRAAVNDLGIESTGKVVENVRKKTGLTNMETQAKLASELTGGENSLMDQVQRAALSATEDGKPYRADTSKILSEVDGIVDRYADANTLNNREQFIKNIKASINNDEADLISISNRFKSIAADARGKGVANPSTKDAATAKIYTEIAHKLDDLSYSTIPQSNVNDMFDVTISEMRGRANQAKANGNTDIAKAYNTLADSLDSQPRTIQSFRSFKKDFVDISQVNRLSMNAENGAAIQMGRGFGGGVKRMFDTLMQRPVNAGLAVGGGVVNSLADKVSGSSKTSATISPAATNTPTPESQTSRVFYNMLGRETGEQQANQVADTISSANADQMQQYRALQNMAALQSQQNAPTYRLDDGMEVTLEDVGFALQEAANAGDIAAYNQLGQIYSALQSAQSNGTAGVINNTAEVMAGNNILSQLQQASYMALLDGDIKSFNALASLYESAQKMYGTQQVELTSADRTTLQNLNNSISSLDQLESLYNAAGGGKGFSGNLDNLANFFTNGAANYNLSTYNSAKESLGMAIVKNFVNLGATESDAKRYAAMLPEITDTPQMAQQKLSTLRNLIQQAQQNVYAQY